MRPYQRSLRDGVAVAAIAIGLSAFTTLTAAAASPGANAEAEVEEVVVTARLRQETLLETPLAITAFTAEQLENRQIDSVRDLASLTPGLGFEQASSTTSSRPVIRGLSQLARSSGDISNVGVFVDGVYSSGLSGTDLGFAGVERVEVIRGPQSALYGRNTFAGAINFITKKPGATPEYGGRAQVGDNGMWGFDAYAAGPLSDNFGMRLDASKSSTGGTFRNQVTDERLSDTDAEMVRASFQFTPMTALTVHGSLSYMNDVTSPAALIVIPDDSPRRIGKPAPTSRSPVQVGRRVAGPITDYTETYSFDANATGGDRTSYRGTLGAELEMGPATLVYLGGYETRDVYTFSDLDQTPLGTRFTPTVLTQTGSGDIEDRFEFSHNLRLQSSNPGRLDWVVGAYFSRERNVTADIRYATPALGTGGTTAPLPDPAGNPRIDQQDLYRNTFKSVYGSFTFNFTEAMSLTAEGRQTEETKFAQTLQNNYGSDRGTIGVVGKETFKYFTPRFIANYNPNRNLNLYASAAKGTKSGGFNPTAIIAPEKIFDPESNWTYELGAKFAMFDGRAQIAAAVYRIDWTDQQILVFATGAAADTSITGNIAKSEVKGAEIQGNFRATRWLRLDASYAYTDARYVDGFSTSFANFVDCAAQPNLECVNGVTTGRIDGNQLQFSPKHMVSLGAEVQFPVNASWDFVSRADLSMHSKKYVDGGNSGYIPKREDLRLRAGFQDDTYRINAFCDNVTNNKIPVTAFVSRDFNGGPHYYARARDGRMCGVSLSAAF
jgi:iron complex outermembrane recepter protein